MPDIDAVFQRIANDPEFADAVRTDPTNALRPYRLDVDDLARVDAALHGRRPADISALFGTSTRRVGAATFATAGAAAAIVVAFALGWSGALGGGATGPVLALDAVDVHMCSSDTTTGAVIGVLHRGDRVWMIGRSGEQWLVIRDPQALGSPAWVRSTDVVRAGDTADLVEVDCATATVLASAAVPVVTPDETIEPTSDPAVSTVPADTAAPGTTPSAPGTTVSTTLPTTVPSTVPTSVPTTVAPPPTTATPPASTVAPTTIPDQSGPDLAVATDRPLFYSEGASSCASYPQRVRVTVTATDPTAPVTVGAVRWSAGALSGAATPIGPNLFEIGPISSTHSGTISMTITASATDGLGNRTERSTTVSFSQVADTCIG